ncbi:hypothetical protein HDF16_001911 [Granulicella aggregans]|uniref:Uncharacterized protein n=1 Tax=Granulicella aggregans TaxID=474949 RepID=A0A7W8E397_9BACT|nr:hypothetical protein [Granulicella aggregans]MBB5057226.1 hypothetical protein [Granulicella aggregans]
MPSGKSDRKPAGHDQPVDPESATQTSKATDKKSPSPGQCRNYTRKAVAKSLPDIIVTFVAQAKGGSVSHFNHLAKFGGFDLRPIPASVKRKGKSFAQRLLNNMKEHEAKMIASRDAKLAAERESCK